VGSTECKRDVINEPLSQHLDNQLMCILQKMTEHRMALYLPVLIEFKLNLEKIENKETESIEI
jgi:hypothetical protein